MLWSLIAQTSCIHPRGVISLTGAIFCLGYHGKGLNLQRIYGLTPWLKGHPMLELTLCLLPSCSCLALVLQWRTEKEKKESVHAHRLPVQFSTSLCCKRGAWTPLFGGAIRLLIWSKQACSTHKEKDQGPVSWSRITAWVSWKTAWVKHHSNLEHALQWKEWFRV